MKLDPGKLKGCQVSLGCDPEFFYLRDDNVAMNADRFLPGKDNKLYTEGNRGSLFFDGFQGELNVRSGYCREDIIGSIRTCLRKARAAAGKKSRGKRKYRIAMEPAVAVLPEILAKADDEARIFGCDPDFDAYAGGANPPGPDAESHYVRYSGGHIHIGGNHIFLQNEKHKRQFVKLLDVVAGIPMVLLDRHEGNKARRELYGRAGCYRSPHYGVEWRTPSNFWLKSPELASLMLGITRVAAKVMNSKQEKCFFSLVDEDAVRYAIDMNDFDVAKEIYKVIKPNLVEANSGASDPLHKTKTRYFSTGREYVYVDLPGNAMFEYVVYKGIDNFFGSLDYEWYMGMKERSYDRQYVNGWYSGVQPRIWKKHYPEFSEFCKGAKHSDIVNF